MKVRIVGIPQEMQARPCVHHPFEQIEVYWPSNDGQVHAWLCRYRLEVTQWIKEDTHGPSTR